MICPQNFGASHRELFFTVTGTFSLSYKHRLFLSVACESKWPDDITISCVALILLEFWSSKFLPCCWINSVSIRIINVCVIGIVYCLDINITYMQADSCNCFFSSSVIFFISIPTKSFASEKSIQTSSSK